MVEVIFANAGFWINFFVPVAFALWMRITHPEYIWKEFGLQVGATFIYLAMVYSLLFYTTTDLYNTEYHNGYIKEIDHNERWTQRSLETYQSCSGSGKSRVCTTKTRWVTTHHPDEYYILTTNGEIINISRNQFNQAAKKYGKKFVRLHHIDQVSIGDGNRYEVYPTDVIPTAVGHEYINYIIAAKDSVLNKKATEKEIQQYIKNKKLRSYPVLYRSEFGATKLNRIVNATHEKIPAKWLKTLDEFAAVYGRSKEINPIIYLTDEDRSIKRIIQAYWKGGHKNDIILILGINDGEVMWSDGIAYPKDEGFLIDLANDFDGMKISENEIIPRFRTLIQNGYKRKSMKEFEYLKENLSLEWYWQLLIIIINIILSYFISRWFISNDNDQIFSRRWSRRRF